MRRQGFCLTRAGAWFLVLAGGLVGAVGAEPLGAEKLRALYETVRPVLDNPTPEDPFYLKAQSKHHVESGEAALYFPQSVTEIGASLATLSSWCEILPLHINVKACTYNDTGDRMTVYLGRKFYQAPENAYRLEYDFRIEAREDYFAAWATAAEGPLGTSDYHIEFEVIPVGGKSFGRIHVSDHQSWLSSRALDVYLSTKGKDKRGISVVGHDDQGHPIYSSGEEAVAERNLVRYYLAFAAFFEFLDVADPTDRHEAQLDYWFSHTEKFPQLYEMDRTEYLGQKRRERANQVALQAEQ